ncbi:hypothetical protein SI65_00954 [Aspergillus cristatus]|uniref:Uncharacterized protein n=1 Tax=Aspergillus cristatus TaxID=573508 RepID=A0A1E3BQZ0_ASPCR|nr:hypothetical protein SI65_00954 [Aspergillus cristatus]
MFSRTPWSPAGLLNPQSLQTCREKPLSLISRRYDLLLRSKSTTSNNSDGKPRRRRQPKPKAQHVPIDVSFLGEQGGVVVVPEAKNRQKKPALDIGPDRLSEKGDVPFLLQEIEDETVELTGEIVNERIESLLAPHSAGDKLDAVEFEKLRWKVQASFTGYQLADYVSEHKRNAEEFYGSGESGNDSRAMEWRPGTPGFLEMGPVGQGGVADRIAVTKKSLKGKHLLAERILRDCWELEVVGEAGQIDIRLSATTLSLLKNSEIFSFEEVASLNDAKIDITNSLGLVRITGSRVACETIRDIIQDTSLRIREEEVELFPRVGNRFDGSRAFHLEFLDWVSRAYGVAFEGVTREGPKKILYLAENREGMENARRTLNLAIYSTNPDPLPFTSYFSATEPAEAYDFSLENDGNWFERQKAWFRWAMPSTQAAGPSPLDMPLFDQHQTRLSDGLLKILRKPSSKYQLGKKVDVHESVTAAVGRCLFLRKPTMSRDPVDATTLSKLSLPRSFTTDLPRVASFLRQLQSHEGSDKQQLRRVLLVPSALHANVFPQLDLEVSLQENSDSEAKPELLVHNAKAIITQNSVDYLLPENGLDLRFTRKMYCDLPEESWQESADVLKTSLRDNFIQPRPNDSGDVSLPTFFKLSLPREILNQKNLSGSEKEFVAAEYMSLPLVDRRGTYLHRYDYEDKRLNYSYYESGPFYPSRVMDLFLDMDLPSDSKIAEEEGELGELLQKFNSFYGSACKLAFELDTARRAEL